MREESLKSDTSNLLYCYLAGYFYYLRSKLLLKELFQVVVTDDIDACSSKAKLRKDGNVLGRSYSQSGL